MNPSINYSWNTWRVAILIAGLLYLLFHFYPHFSPSIILSSDDRHVSTALSYLADPDLYQSGGIVSSVQDGWAVTAPLYSYPASLLVGYVAPINIPRLIGLVFGILTFLLAGKWWGDWRDGIRAVVVTVVFVHLAGSVNPMLGLPRSVILPGLLLFIHPISRSNLWIRYLGLAFVVGVHPPAGVFLIGFTVMEYLVKRRGMYDGTSSLGSVLKLIAHGLVFLVMILPMLMNRLLFNGASRGIEFVRSTTRHFQTLSGFVRSYVTGSGGALFPVPSTFEMFMVFLALSLIGYLLIRRSRRRFVVPTDGALVILASMVLWGISTVSHTPLYDPGRYSGAGALLGVLLMFTRNLSSTGTLLRQWFQRHSTVRLVAYLLPVVGIVQLGYFLYVDPTVFRRWFLLRRLFWPGVVCGILVLVVGLSLSASRQNSVLCLLVFVMATFMVSPHYVGQSSGKDFNPGLSATHRTLLDAVNQLPRDAVLAGPAGLMNWVTAYSRRDVYFNQEQDSVKRICDRSKAFTTVYFAPDRGTIESYFRSTPVTHLIVDRAYFRGKSLYQCGGRVRFEGEGAYLDRVFKGAVWSWNDRLYLINRDRFLSGNR